MKLIALDLDGTTLNSKKEMAPETLDAIKKAQEQGHIVMAMSGRSYKGIKRTLDQYNLDCPIGANNGTCLYEGDSILHLITLSNQQTAQTMEVLEKECIPYNITTDKGTYAPRTWDERLATMLTSGRVPEEFKQNPHYKMFTTSPHVHGHFFFDDSSEILNDNEFTFIKILMVTLDPEQKKRVYQSLSLIKEVMVLSSSPFNLEMTHASGSKGKGLEFMARHHGISMKDTIAIGDEMNDVPMFQVAGLAIAMGNAEDEVKQHSHVVTLTNDEHGVAHAIKKYVLEE